MTALYRAEVINGFDDNTFRPKESMTRAQAAKLFARIYSFKHNSASRINLYIMDEYGNEVTNAMAFYYTQSPDIMNWTSDFSLFGDLAAPYNMNGMYGVNVFAGTTMYAFPSLIYPRKEHYYVRFPTDRANNIPVPNYTPGTAWQHSNCSDSWAYNNNNTYCPTAYVKSCQNFGWRYLNGVRQFHAGIDIGGGGKEARNVAGKKTKVVAARYQYSAGNYVQLKNESGTLFLTYMHLSSCEVKKMGQVVANGALVGFTGNTGDSYGAHLHLGISTTYLLFPGNDAGNRAKFMDPRVYIN